MKFILSLLAARAEGEFQADDAQVRAGNAHRQRAPCAVDLRIGPEAPKGKEKNWIPTAPGRGWFGLFRLYAPTEAYFDRSWRLPDIVRVK